MRIPELAALAARLLLAFVFLLAGATKLVDPVGLRQTWNSFGLPAVFARPMILLLPLAELAVAVLLVPAPLAWYGAWGAGALLVVFLLAMGIALALGRKPDCRCFGRVHAAPVGWGTMARDGALAGCAGWLIERGPLNSGPGLWAWLSTLNSDGRKAALISASVVAFVFFRMVDRSRPQSQPIEVEEAAEEEEEDDRPEPPRRSAPARRPRPAEPPELPPSTAKGVGLAIGTPAPAFELPAMTGERRSLAALREQGRDILLVFSSPFCTPCTALAPKLARWAREAEPLLEIFIVSRGHPRDNAAKLKEFDPSRVLLQRNFEISDAYDCNATPTGVVVGADGLIRTELAVGRDAIQQLVAPYSKRA